MDIVEATAVRASARSSRDRRICIGLAGAQSSGKSTIARAYAVAHPSVACLSLDDFYLGSRARARLAERVHPLFATRGVPGTHDVTGLVATIVGLGDSEPDDETLLPVFDKLADDPLPRDQWRRFRGRPAMILVEGWCIGALPQADAALAEPVNGLEHDGTRRAFGGGTSTISSRGLTPACSPGSTRSPTSARPASSRSSNGGASSRKQCWAAP